MLVFMHVFIDVVMAPREYPGDIRACSSRDNPASSSGASEPLFCCHLFPERRPQVLQRDHALR